MTTRIFPNQIQVFLFDTGEISMHPVFEEWEHLCEHYFDLPVIEKLEFDDTMDKIVKDNRKKLMSQPIDELGRKIIIIENVLNYFTPFNI